MLVVRNLLGNYFHLSSIRSTLVHFGSMAPRCLPPNILIHEGRGNGHWLRRFLQVLFGADNYVFYDLPVSSDAVWMDYARLLVVAGPLEERVGSGALRHLSRGGRVLSLDSDLVPHVIACRRHAEPSQEAEQQCRPQLQVKYRERHTAKFRLGRHYHTVLPRPAPSSGVTICFPCEISGDTDWSHVVVRADVPNDDCVEKPGVALFCQLALPQLQAEQSADQLELVRSLIAEQLHVECTGDLPAANTSLTCPSLLCDAPVTGVLAGAWTDLDMTLFSSASSRPDSMHTASHQWSLSLDNIMSRDGDNPTTMLLQRAPLEGASFDYALFLRELGSECHVGRKLLHCRQVTSTMDVASALQRAHTATRPRDISLASLHGVLVLADRQSQGRGRRGSQWLSPAGMCMFTVLVTVSLSADNPRSAAKLSWQQHLAALAVCRAVDTLCAATLDNNEQAGCVRVKWPNDIYWRDSYKLGGVAVETSCCHGNGSSHSVAVCSVGVGLNLDNSRPVAGLNSLLATPLRRECLVAQFCAEFEALSTLYDADAAIVVRQYRRRWLHEQQSVSVRQETHDDQCPDSVKAVVCGLDEYGYLRVRLCHNEHVVSVSPADNSFDMMRGLIVPKISA